MKKQVKFENRIWFTPEVCDNEVNAIKRQYKTTYNIIIESTDCDYRC